MADINIKNYKLETAIYHDVPSELCPKCVFRGLKETTAGCPSTDKRILLCVELAAPEDYGTSKTSYFKSNLKRILKAL